MSEQYEDSRATHLEIAMNYDAEVGIYEFIAHEPARGDGSRNEIYKWKVAAELAQRVLDPVTAFDLDVRRMRQEHANAVAVVASQALDIENLDRECAELRIYIGLLVGVLREHTDFLTMHTAPGEGTEKFWNTLRDPIEGAAQLFGLGLIDGPGSEDTGKTGS